MIEDAHAAGASVYDLRGITDTLDSRRPALRPHPVQGGNGRRGGRVRRRVGLPPQPGSCTEPSPTTWGAANRCSRSTSRPSAGAPTRRRLTAQLPTIVPVAKGNGYGFGLAMLGAETERLGCDTLAVGTLDEAPLVHDALPRRRPRAHSLASCDRPRACRRRPADAHRLVPRGRPRAVRARAPGRGRAA